MGTSRSKKGQSNKSQKLPQSKEPLPKTIKRKSQKSQAKDHKVLRLWLFLKRIIVWFFVLLSGLVAVLYFYPRVSIKSVSLMRPYNPFYYPFIINNSGNIKVVNIKYILLISKITTNSNNQINNVKFQDINTQYSINQIEAGGSNPIDITYAFGMNGPIIKSAQVFIKYDYLIPILKHHFTDSTKFVLFKDDNNQYTWIEYQN